MNYLRKPSQPAYTLAICFVLITLFITGCEERDKACKKCNADYRKEKKVRIIKHYDETSTLRETYYFYYYDQLLDSIEKFTHMEPSAKLKVEADVREVVRVYYPSKKCIPSYYEARTYVPANPVELEKGIMSISGDVITNRHLAFYPDDMLLVPDHTAEIDYHYNGSDQVTIRSGTDYGLLVYPHPYGNENYYTYTGDNITEVSAWKEQAGYDLDKTFDNKNNPFSIQSGVMYYLTLIAYTDEEYFETICRDENNVTEMVYKGTDTSNSFVTITFSFTYSYDADDYPTKVAIYEVKEDEVYGDSETDHGTYRFEYY